MIVFLTLLALPHGVSDGLLIWLPLLGLLFGFPVLVTGLNVLVRSLLVIVLMVVVFNFLTPALLQERAFIAVIPADSWQASVVASLNPILLTLAALLTGFSSVVSRFVPGEPANGAEISSEKQVAMESSRRQQAWAKLKRP